MRDPKSLKNMLNEEHNKNKSDWIKYIDLPAKNKIYIHEAVEQERTVWWQMLTDFRKSCNEEGYVQCKLYKEQKKYLKGIAVELRKHTTLSELEIKQELRQIEENWQK